MSSRAGALSNVFSCGPVAYVGLISYSIYLWHYPIARYFREDTEPHLTFLIIASSSFVLASASWYLLERPMNDIRRRFGRPLEASQA